MTCDPMHAKVQTEATSLVTAQEASQHTASFCSRSHSTHGTSRTRHSALTTAAARARHPFGHIVRRIAPPAIASASRVSPRAKDRLTRVQQLFTRNPSPPQSSRLSPEYLLLPPRSAPAAAPVGLTPSHLPRTPLRSLLLTEPSRPVEKQAPRPNALAQRPGIGGSLQRHPFSGPVASAGESLHTPWRMPTSMATVLLSLATDAFNGV
jgi:hypothetical protein